MEDTYTRQSTSIYKEGKLLVDIELERCIIKLMDLLKDPTRKKIELSFLASSLADFIINAERKDVSKVSEEV